MLICRFDGAAKRWRSRVGSGKLLYGEVFDEMGATVAKKWADECFSDLGAKFSVEAAYLLRVLWEPHVYPSDRGMLRYICGMCAIACVELINGGKSRCLSKFTRLYKNYAGVVRATICANCDCYPRCDAARAPSA